MKEFLKTLSNTTKAGYTGIIDVTGETKIKSEIISRQNSKIAKDILTFLELTKPIFQKSLYIPNIQKYIQEYSISKKYIYPANFHSIFLYSIIVNRLDLIICIADTKEDPFDQKDLLLINTLCENYYLKSKSDFNEPELKTETKELFQIIFNSVPEAISFHELPSHKAIMVNKAFEEFTGYTQDEVLNKTGNELNLWVDDNKRTTYRNTLLKNGFVNNFSAKFRIKGGKIGTGLISGKIVLFQSKPHLLLIIRDISNIQKVQNELADSEKKFRNLFNSLPDPVSINKLDESMAFTDINKAFLQNMGLDKEDLIGKSGFELGLWADPVKRDTYINTIKKFGEINNFQARIKFPNGNIEEGLISAKTIKIKETPHLLVILKSIDSLIKLKRNLQISENKFRSIFNSSPDAININKLDNVEFIDINRSFTQITGYTKQELLGKSINDFNFWQSQDDQDFYIKELTAKGRINNFETKIRLKNGHIIHALISAMMIKIGGVPHIVNLSRNIEELKSIERGLKESEKKFRTIVEKSHAAILIIDNKQKLLYTNPKAQELFGYNTNELAGMNFEHLLHPDSIQLVKERYLRRQSGANVPERYEFQILQKNGNIKDVEISSSVYIDKNGEKRTISQLLDITERKKAFAKIKKEQQKAQYYLDIAAFMIISIDKKGIIKLVNRKACDILGYSEKELIGQNWFELCVPKSIRIQLKRKAKELFNKYPSKQSESIIETKDGKERTINWHSAVIFDDYHNPTEILSAGEDITDKVNSLKIINQTKTVAIIWKYIKDSNFHPISYVSNNIEKLIGYTSSELTSGKIRYIDLIHPDDLNHVLNEVNEHINEENLNQYTHDYYRLRTKSGNYIWVEDQTEFITNENGEITHLSGILIDVTERKRNLELLKSSEERYKTVFYSNLDGMVIFNDEGKIIEVNDTLCKMYGYSRDELLNRKDHTEINIGSDLHLSYVKKQLNNTEVISSESIDTKKDGSKFHVSTKLRWILYNNQNHILAIFRDISEKKENEIELLKAKEKAEESDRLKSSFLANMSHEIRTPMNAIIGFSSLLEESDIGEEEKLSFINRIKNNSQLLLGLINDIIDISKIEANQVNFVYSKIEVNHLIQSIYELVELEAQKKKIHLTYECHNLEKMTGFQSDPNRLTQIMTNLISNALKFTPEEGQITLGSYPSEETGEIIFYVKDTGIGIEKEAQEHIFQRFRQAHVMTFKDYGGTGLGLSIVKGLIESMNGRIWVESDLGKGSQFFIALPLKPKLVPQA